MAQDEQCPIETGFRYINLGRNNIILVANSSAKYYPNRLHAVVTLVAKHQITDKNKYETTHPKVDMSKNWVLFETDGLKALYFQGVETESFQRGGGQADVFNLHLRPYRRLEEVKHIAQVRPACMKTSLASVGGEVRWRVSHEE